MGRILAILIVTVGLLGLMATEGHALFEGPFCFSTLPFTNVFVWFVQSSGGNQLIGTGRDVTLNRAQSVSGFVSENIAFVNFQTSSGTSGHPIIGGGTLSLSGTFPGTGPGFCHTVNSTGGCGTGASFTFAPIACPPGSTLDAARTEGPTMDATK